MVGLLSNVYICVKVAAIIAALLWVVVTCSSFMPSPFCPPDIVPHPPHFPSPNPPREYETI